MARLHFLRILRGMKQLANLTTDPDELDVLYLEDADSIDPDDPFYLDQAARLHEMAQLRMGLPPKRRAIATALVGRLTLTSQKALAEELDVSMNTIYKTKNDPRVRRMLVLAESLNHHRKGPSMESRAALLWRIALRNENTKPRIAISAVDILNKQMGVYKPDDNTPAAAQINVVNFNFQSEAKPLGDMDLPSPNQTKNEDAIEGEFTPVEVTINSDD